MSTEWKRKCPKCGEEIPYTRKQERDRAEKRNTNCYSCANSGKNNSMYGKCAYNIWFKKYGKEEADKRQIESNKKHGDSVSRKNNPMYRKSVYNVWLKKYGKEEADKRQIESNRKKSETSKGQKRSEETKLKMRISRFKYINSLYGVKFPNHNPVACGIINDYNKKYNFNFQHAENGGEVNIGGYFPDGVDEKRKTIIEVDEKQHFSSDGTLKQKDIQRQKYLENLGYKFIRVRI